MLARADYFGAATFLRLSGEALELARRTLVQAGHRSGVSSLSFEKDTDGPRKRKPAAEEDMSKPKPPKKRPPANEVGSALRSVYDRALAEDIPPEMLDLLGKLG